MKPSLTLRQWLSQSDFTLALSSSFFGFFAHCGFVTALFEEKLMPKKITGSSAGALVGAAVASGLSPHELKELLFSIRKNDFWDPKLGLGFLKGERFHSLLAKHLVPSFAETKIPIEIAVLDLLAMKTKFLTAGNLPKAVAASCAVPLMFQPVRIESRYFADGGVFRKSGVNPQNIHENTFCVYLQTRGLVGLYERGKDLKNASSKVKIIHFKKIPSVNPNSLETGRLAYADTYQRAKFALSRKIQSNGVIEA